MEKRKEKKNEEKFQVYRDYCNVIHFSLFVCDPEPVLSDKNRNTIMFSTISAKLLLVVGVAILLTGQMSYCDNGEKVVSNKNGTKNSPPKSDAVEVAKKIAEPVKPVVEEKEPAPVKNGAAIPVAPAAVVAPVPAIDDVNVNNKYARQNLLKNQTEIPGTIQTAFYVFVAFGLVVIFYISYRSYR